MPAESHLFRQAALEHQFAEEEGAEVLRLSPPWSWAIFGTLSSLMVVVLLASVVVRVEVNSRARGILRPAGGVRVLTAQVTGVVSNMNAASGLLVEAGQPLLRVDSAQALAALTRAERDLAVLETDSQAFSRERDNLFASQVSAVRGRLGLLLEQEASLSNSMALFERKLRATTDLVGAGLLGKLAEVDAQEGLAQIQRQRMGVLQALSQAKQELAALKDGHQAEEWRRRDAIQGARAQRDALVTTLRQSTVGAPARGYLEGILIRPGDVLREGQQVGKLIPEGTPLHVVSFLPERDRAFVKAGDPAFLELDRFPYLEFGALPARVVRISGDLASAYEIAEAFGDDARLAAPAYRIELEVEPDRYDGRVQLRPSMLMNVRFCLRQQRLLTLVVQPLGRWLN